jgi:hypothetical protein
MCTKPWPIPHFCHPCQLLTQALESQPFQGAGGEVGLRGGGSKAGDGCCGSPCHEWCCHGTLSLWQAGLTVQLSLGSGCIACAEIIPRLLAEPAPFCFIVACLTLTLRHIWPLSSRGPCKWRPHSSILPELNGKSDLCSGHRSDRWFRPPGIPNLPEVDFDTGLNASFLAFLVFVNWVCSIVQLNKQDFWADGLCQPQQMMCTLHAGTSSMLGTCTQKQASNRNGAKWARLPFSLHLTGQPVSGWFRSQTVDGSGYFYEESFKIRKITCFPLGSK